MLLAALLTFLPQGPIEAEPAEPAPRDLASMLREVPRCAAILEKAAEHRLQVLLAEPVERSDGSIVLVKSRLGDPDRYFYPASSIKLCGALALLATLNAHNRAHGTAVGLDSPLVIEPRFSGDQKVERDPSNLDGGVLTVRHALRKLFLVSDNQAYNHCLEVTGQDGVNGYLWQAGFPSARLWHRLSEARTRDENERTRAVQVGGVTFPARDAAAPLSNEGFADRRIGDGYLAGGALVEMPMSFDEKNAIRLDELQDVLVEVVRPEIDTGRRGFPELTVEQRAFVVQSLGELPRESPNPHYDPEQVPDHTCKFVLRGVRRVVPDEHLRVYDKIGRAYGFSIENAYVEDTRTGRGFFLAIVLYTNPDGVLNDDAYAYEEIADPFLDDAGEVIARAVFGAAPR